MRYRFFTLVLLFCSCCVSEKKHNESANMDTSNVKALPVEEITNGDSLFIHYIEQRGKALAPSYQKRNCVQFMDTVLKEYCHIDSNTSERIYIKYELEYLKKLYTKGDTAILSGVCAALVDGGKARWIKIENIKQGDIIQYWSDNGFFNGHCGVYWGKDKEGNILLKGSHPDSNGYGIMNMYNKNQYFRIYCVRLN